MRADVFLVERGHAATRSQAQRLIASGVEWRLTPLSPWNKVAKNGDDIPSVAEVRLLDEFVWRARDGGWKVRLELPLSPARR